MSSLEQYGDNSYFRFPVQEQFFDARIYVWWDMMSCPWPEKNDLTSIRRNIESALKNVNYRGNVTIFAYSTNTIPDHVRAELGRQGIDVRVVEEDEEIRIMIPIDIILCAYDHPIPANYLVISDIYFLRATRFYDVNVLFAAQEPKLKGVFRHRAANIWYWSTLATGGFPVTKQQIKGDGLHAMIPDMSKWMTKSG